MSRHPPYALGPRSLGEAVRLLRHRARVSREELARLVGVSTGAISNYENDVSTPPAPTLRRLAVVLSELLQSPPTELWEQLGKIMDEVPGGPRAPGRNLDR